MIGTLHNAHHRGYAPVLAAGTLAKAAWARASSGTYRMIIHETDATGPAKRGTQLRLRSKKQPPRLRSTTHGNLLSP